MCAPAATRDNSCAANYYVCAFACAYSDPSTVSKEGARTDGRVHITEAKREEERKRGREALSSTVRYPLLPLRRSAVLIIIYGATLTTTIAQRLLLADSQLGQSRNRPDRSFVRTFLRSFKTIRKRKSSASVINLTVSRR